MQKLCLDTDIIIRFLRINEDYKSIFKSIRKGEIEAYISAVTCFELYLGAFLSMKPVEEATKVKALMQWFKIIDIDDYTSLLAAKVYAEAKKSGKMKDMRDIFIAGCALSKNLKLATLNKKHFEGITGLTIK